jgi:hypothetical protein
MMFKIVNIFLDTSAATQIESTRLDTSTASQLDPTRLSTQAAAQVASKPKAFSNITNIPKKRGRPPKENGPKTKKLKL